MTIKPTHEELEQKIKELEKEAIEEISMGKIYDPNVVDACLRLFRKKGLSLDSWRNASLPAKNIL